ncbi:MAG: CO dehydrogenase/CO-methylating acetyl-CoA synthase complex subunit beta [Clostridia bacterium]|nr:CO dehydrogenase/CO-methylating acetyl-CoA synthase complex subunit beta [Clostridia bacterium]
MGLFERVFRGSDEMYFKAEAEVNAAIAELGEDAAMTMPDTAYFLACIYAYLGDKVTTLGELKAALAKVREMMTRENRTASIFSSGIATAIAAEIIEACKYARTATPYEGTQYHGHFSDAEVRELGVPLVTRDIPGFVVMIGPAPSVEEAVETVKGYQSRGIFVFMIGGIIDQVHSAGMNTGFPVRVVPVGEDIWSVGHVISLVTRATMIFGATEPGDAKAFHEYTMQRIFAFVNAYAPVNDITVACGAGAIKMGFPVITNDTNDTWAIPKSLLIQTNTKDWIETSLEARDIKIKVTNIDIPVAFSSAYEGEIIRKKDMQIEMDGSRVDCIELVRTKEAHEIEDHSIIVEGPDFDQFEVGAKIPIAYIVEVAGKTMQTDFEGVFERKFHSFLNCIEGVMHTGQRDMIRIRVSKASFEAGFRARHIGEVLYAKIKSEYDTVVDKCQVRIYTDPEKVKALRAEGNEIFDKRDERLKTMTDESVDVFYTCILCQAFSPSHVCIVTPERLGLCGAVSWLDAKATNELDPNGPCQIVTKNNVVDERTGMTPMGMSFSELASMTGGGVQTPGFMGHGKHYISSKKFLKAEGGPARIVWLPKALKDQIADKLNETALELYGIENFTDMIADETICTEDPEQLLNYLSEVGHPVLGMEPLM